MIKSTAGIAACCAFFTSLYILMKRSTREMAALSGVEPKSIRMSKYRLKQKPGLDKEQDPDEFVRNIA